ncbi:protein disulfide-isomerase A5 [Bacillus rossius redtenbacheri]|uniref:protein disulfide-isomerase A5 n=1 Tax=Bacillus rossius redtenbacheri TaxID=93214 RepID=UPI002FDDE221
MNAFNIVLFLLLLLRAGHFHARQGAQRPAVDEVSDLKEFKKLLRTKTNVLVCFVSSVKQAAPTVKVFREAADAVRGQGTMLLVDCSGEAKKMCRKMKVSPEPYMLKHYKDGDFHKDYDRLLSPASMVAFMRDPAGDAPWEEDTAAGDVVHVPDAPSLGKFLRKEMRPTMVMFYAPWCGFCKQLKPEYAAAATALRDRAALAAVDVNRPENAAVRHKFNITGFPTLLYFENGSQKYVYEGENNKDGIVGFMHNPHRPPEKAKEPEWSETKSDVVHLTAATFDQFLKAESSVLVMFYAPWCGHCKKMKPEYEKAAKIMKDEQIPGALAAVDATKETTVTSRFGIRGYPTVKYFRGGELGFDVSVRTAGELVGFMRDPREPPPPPPPERPWSEEASEVVHLGEDSFKPFLRKKKHVLVMFYAPWCGHCKKAKPEFSAAAEEFKDDTKVEFAAVDCTEHSAVCSALDVKGYPTFKYFHYYSKESKPYNGGRVKADFVSFMRDPQNPLAGMVPPASTDDPAEAWGMLEGAEHVVHLTDVSFDKHIREGRPTLVMFYAPWCGHCKRLKPAYCQAAAALSEDGSRGVLAAVDSTANPALTDRFKVHAFPTLKLFAGGAAPSDYERARTVEDIVAFMKTVGGGQKRDEL